jgi:hypothetical protein
LGLFFWEEKFRCVCPFGPILSHLQISRCVALEANSTLPCSMEVRGLDKGTCCLKFVLHLKKTATAELPTSQPSIPPTMLILFLLRLTAAAADCETPHGIRVHTDYKCLPNVCGQNICYSPCFAIEVYGTDNRLLAKGAYPRRARKGRGRGSRPRIQVLP